VHDAVQGDRAQGQPGQPAATAAADDEEAGSRGPPHEDVIRCTDLDDHLDVRVWPRAQNGGDDAAGPGAGCLERLADRRCGAVVSFQ
jgi:hypothetical protein